MPPWLTLCRYQHTIEHVPGCGTEMPKTIFISCGQKCSNVRQRLRMKASSQCPMNWQYPVTTYQELRL